MGNKGLSGNLFKSGRRMRIGIRWNKISAALKVKPPGPKSSGK